MWPSRLSTVWLTIVFTHPKTNSPQAKACVPSNNLINRNLALMNNCGQYNNKEEKVLLNV